MGAPLTEEAWENGLTVQYFEWAKLEWHKDYPAGKQIVQTSLGRQWLLDHPAPETAMVQRTDYQVLGQATTSFRDSIPGRVHNLTLATQRFNGTVVQPGAVFSFNKTLGPDGASAGFVIAKIIYNGRTIDGIGGGICQVATTAFRAAFYSGVDIVERHPHTYRVSFYEPPVGFDATVFSDEGVDLRWRNNLSVPILIQTAVDSRAQTITFTYLATQPAKYKVAFAGPVIKDIVKHGPPIYEDDPKLPYGTVTQTEHAKDGMTTVVTRTLTDPATGKVVRTETYSSRYVAWNDRFSRGTKGKPRPTATPVAPAAAPAGPATATATP
jgi:vancomycin resistance protein YoaR